MADRLAGVSVRVVHEEAMVIRMPAGLVIPPDPAVHAARRESRLPGKPISLPGGDPMPYRLHAALVLSLLAGCATQQMQPVADFGAAANKLATDYKPFATGLATSCEERQRYMAVGNAGMFDAAAAEREAASLCGPLKQAGVTAALFGQALAEYASALAKASGAKPTVFDTELRDVGTAAGKLVMRDDTPMFNSTKLSAATKIARTAAELLMEGRLQQLTRATLEDNHESLRIVVEAMTTYAGEVYAGQLADTHDIMSGELGRLVAASNAPTQADVDARLPWRYAQAATRADIAANELETRRVRAFAKTAAALVEAHAALIANFDKLDGVKRLQLVTAFVKQVQALNDDAAAL